MNVNFTARQTVLTPDIKQYCQKRLKSLEKLMRTVIEVDIILTTEKNRNKAEIHVKAKGASLVVIEETQEMFESLKLAFDYLAKKVKKEREKFREKKRRKGRERKDFETALEGAESEKRIIRSHDYSPKPMPIEEAVLEFDLTKKDIFVFRKEGSEKWAVLFRRKDGHYGLIEPE